MPPDYNAFIAESQVDGEGAALPFLLVEWVCMYKPNFKEIPIDPGIYLMKDKAGDILYVGKAKNLRKRVTSYWAKPAGQSIKTQVLVAKIAAVETVAVRSEVEALILENEFIKKHRPPFNVLMRDDKSYLYIRITMQEEFPRILLARRVANDGARYFGPYIESRPVYDLLKLIKKIFPICSSPQAISNDKLAKGVGRACLNYHLGICGGVCIGKVSVEEYRAVMQEVIRFIGGQYDAIARDLKKAMQQAAGEKRFERAAKLRDSLEAIEKIGQRQSVVSTNLRLQADVLGVERQLNKAVVAYLRVRKGKLLNSQTFALDSQYEMTDAEVISAFMRDFYLQTEEIPPVILLPVEIADEGVLEQWLAQRAGRQVELVNPSRGARRDLVTIANQNARLRLMSLAMNLNLEKRGHEQGVKDLEKLLKLNKLDRIEAYDISNTQGTDSVGSMVVFEGGKMNKEQYRRFKIRSVVGPDDFASLAEVLQRRFAKLDSDSGFARRPDLIVIDGGKGQVNAVVQALGPIGIPIIGIAKGDHSAPKAKDDIVLPGNGGVIVLPNNAPAKYLLQTIRDEAHRFALGLHTHLARKKVRESELEKIAGVGPATRKKLIKAFGSMRAVKEASLPALAEVVGEKVAGQIKDL